MRLHEILPCKFKQIYRYAKGLSSDNPIAKISLGPGDIAIDCGANVGKVTEVMASACATVYAFEPNPYAFAVLKERFSHNAHVHCYEKGVLDRDDQLKLFMHKNAESDQVKWSTGSSLLDFKSNINSNNYCVVDVIDLAQFIADLNAKVKVLKIDVEGVEYQILNKLIDTGVIHQIEHVFVETHAERVAELEAEDIKLRKKIAENNITFVNLEWD